MVEDVTFASYYTVGSVFPPLGVVMMGTIMGHTGNCGYCSGGN
jgi:hypothetical protein